MTDEPGADTASVGGRTGGEPAALADTCEASRAQVALRVLVVEDNQDAAESLVMLLQMVGHQVEVAATGPDGVAAAKTFRPDAIVCDIGLPGMDGFTVARTLRRDPMTASVRLIAVTGYGTAEDRRKSSEAGFDEHLVKPADPVRLLALLEGR